MNNEAEIYIIFIQTIMSSTVEMPILVERNIFSTMHDGIVMHFLPPGVAYTRLLPLYLTPAREERIVHITQVHTLP